MTDLTHRSPSNGTPVAPVLSAVVVIPDCFETVRRTVRALQAQTIASHMEIVFVVPQREVEIPVRELREFASIQTVVAPLYSVGRSFAAGIRGARAPLIALTEDHSFPAPHWAERLVAAQKDTYAVVAPAVRNGNPNSIVSWANFLIDYGEWASPVPSGTREFLPGHNSMYVGAALAPYMEQLEEWFEAEIVLHWDLRRRGERLWLENSTYTRHYNFAMWKPFLRSHWQAGRIFAAERARAWHGMRRAVYACAAPLIPLVRFARVRRATQRMRFGLGNRIQVYAAIGIGLLVDGFGQGVGYVRGAGDVASFSSRYEFHRFRYIKEADALNQDV
jgi:hypothetical protein